MEELLKKISVLKESGDEETLLHLLENNLATFVKVPASERRNVWEYILGKVKKGYEFHHRTIKLFDAVKIDPNFKDEFKDVDLKKLRFGDAFNNILCINKKKLEQKQHSFVELFLDFVDEESGALPVGNLLAEDDADDATFKLFVEEFVHKRPPEEQVQFIQFASQSVIDNLLPPGQIIAEESPLEEHPHVNHKYTVSVMIVGRPGVGKSCLVNEMHRLPEEERTPEGEGGTRVTTSLHGAIKSYNRKKPLLPWQGPPLPPQPSAQLMLPAPPPKPQLQAPLPMIELQPMAPQQPAEKVDGTKVEIEFIDTPGFEMSETRQAEVWAKIEDRLMQGFSMKPGTPAPINAIVYCISSAPPRMDLYEQQWIRTLSKFAPIILVYTKSIFPVDEFEKWFDQAGLPIQARIQVMSRGIASQRSGFSSPSFGLPQLAREIANVYPLSQMIIKEHRDLLHSNTEADLLAKRNSAYRLIMSASVAAGGVGATPIPFADVLLLVPLQAGMLSGINLLYGVPMPNNILNTLVSAFVGSGTASYLTRLGLRLVLSAGKAIPYVNILASAAQAGLAGTLTMGIGITFLNVLEKLVREYPDYINIDQTTIEKAIFEEAKKQAQRDSSELYDELSNSMIEK